MGRTKWKEVEGCSRKAISQGSIFLFFYFYLLPFPGFEFTPVMSSFVVSFVRRSSRVSGHDEKLFVKEKVIKLVVVFSNQFQAYLSAPNFEPERDFSNSFEH